MSFRLQTNRNVEFGTNQPGLAALGQGWSHPEDGQVWSDGTQATVHFSIDRVPREARLILRATPYLGSGIRHQTLWVFSNGLLLYTGRVDSSGTLTFSVPPYVGSSVLITGSLELTFALPDCHQPDGGGDGRLLGIALHAIELSTTA